MFTPIPGGSAASISAGFRALQKQGLRGDIKQNLIKCQLNAGAARPYIDPKDGQAYVSIFNREDGKYIMIPVENALLQKDEWKYLDRRVLPVAQGILTGINDLKAKGLTENLGSLGVTIVEAEHMSDVSEASVDMSGASEGEEDLPEYTTTGIPVPIIHKGFRLDLRKLEASRRVGQGLDVTGAIAATRKVAWKAEEMLFNGVTLKAGGYSIYGYTNFPQRLRANLTTAWDEGQTTLLTEVEHMIGMLMDNNFMGPFYLYVPTNYWPVLIKDYSTYKNGTYYDRIMAYPQIEAVRPSSVLGSKEIVMVQLTADVVDLVIGQDIVPVEWDEKGGLVQHMKIMACMAPRLRYQIKEDDSSESTSCGICHAFEAGTSTTTTAA